MVVGRVSMHSVDHVQILILFCFVANVFCVHTSPTVAVKIKLLKFDYTCSMRILCKFKQYLKFFSS